MTSPADLDTLIRTVLHEHAHLARPADELEASSDLYGAGLTSHASVNVMLALEDALEVEFPERLLQRRTFASIAALHGVLTELSWT
jgi:acyl carrier protein